MRNRILFISIVIITWSCQGKTDKNSSDNASATPAFTLTELWRTDTIMKTPESVLYDADNGIIYVANMNLTTEENDGFISTLHPDGTVSELEWASGLIAPKGMGIFNGKLYATDETELAVIDIKDPSMIEKIAVENAEFLNDLAIAEDGTVYFTDSRTGKIHIYKNGEVSDWISEGLNRPNGLYLEEDFVLLSSSGSGDVRKIDPESGEMTLMAEGIGAGDGLEFSGHEGYYLVSDWNGEIFMIGNDTIQSLLNTKELKRNTADIGFNMQEKIVYVPTFFDNRVVAYKLVKE